MPKPTVRSFLAGGMYAHSDHVRLESPQTSTFDDILEEIHDLHNRKARDYGTDEDPLSNIRASENFGIPAWLGSVLRGNDKMARLQSFAKKGVLVNEPVEDSLLDLAVYAIIALQLYRESESVVK